jgi:hypothetical protein
MTQAHQTHWQRTIDNFMRSVHSADIGATARWSVNEWINTELGRAISQQYGAEKPAPRNPRDSLRQ